MTKDMPEKGVHEIETLLIEGVKSKDTSERGSHF